jgi:hypothetical protein
MYLIPEKAVFKLSAAAEQTADCTIRSQSGRNGASTGFSAPLPFYHVPSIFNSSGA